MAFEIAGICLLILSMEAFSSASKMLFTINLSSLSKCLHLSQKKEDRLNTCLRVLKKLLVHTSVAYVNTRDGTHFVKTDQDLLFSKTNQIEEQCNLFLHVQ